MKKIINMFLEHVFLYDFIYLVICICFSMLLYICDMRLRTWVCLVLALIFGLLLLIGLIRQFKKKKLIGLIVIIGFTVLAFVFGPFLLFVLAFSYNPEHVVELEGEKYVAIVKSFIDVDVYYYDYYGPLFMGTKLRVHGYFGEGGFDPIENPEKVKKVEYSFYDKNGNIEARSEETINGYLVKKEVTTTTVPVIDEENILKPEDAEVLYEIKYGDLIKRVVVVDYALGQNSLVSVIVSEDNGKTFNWLTNGIIQVGNKAKFIFLDETLGFALNTGKIHLDGSKTSIYVTNDGGQNFSRAKFNYDNEKIDYLDIDGLPYLEDGKLKLKCLEYVNINEEKELIFISKDKGKTWKLEK